MITSEHRLYELTDSRSDSLEFQILEIQARFLSLSTTAF